MTKMSRYQAYREADRLVMAAVDRAGADRSEWEREQVRAELEFDLF